MPFVLLAILVALTSTAQASGAYVSGGGNVILTKNGYRFYDLYEGGVESTSIHPNTGLFRDADLPTPFLSKNARLILESKLEVLSKLDSVLAAATLKAIQYYKWQIQDSKLKRVTEFDMDPLPPNLEQLAVRQFESIYISGELLRQLSDTDTAAFVLHEGLAAIEHPNFPETFTRQFVSLIFSEKSFDELNSNLPLWKAAWPTEAYLKAANLPALANQKLLIGTEKVQPRCPNSVCKTESSHTVAKSAEKILFPFYVLVRDTTKAGLPTIPSQKPIYLQTKDIETPAEDFCQTITATGKPWSLAIAGYRLNLETYRIQDRNTAKLKTSLVETGLLYSESLSGKNCSPRQREEISAVFRLFKQNL